ncbi:hypothetical protein ACFYVK_35585 [Streptomyces chartreusis]|uniref:hypothetical protein n=1 Tax=Streptomyces chartreusis TaxID=1969 RepID=UPI0036C7471E
MALTTPTPADVQALTDFILERANEEWEAASAAHEAGTLDEEAAARFYRISNCNKLGVASAGRALLGIVQHGAPDLAIELWHLLTAAGEEWSNHPDYSDVWENAQRARVRRMIAGG